MTDTTVNTEPAAPRTVRKPATFRVSAQDLKALAVRSDAAGARRALGHLGAIALGGIALWHALGTVWAVPLTLLQGYFIAFLFNVVHETAHQTAFRTRAFNHALGHFAGFAVVLPYEYYRAYHWVHHRHTQDPEKDPELAIPLPRTRAAIASQSAIVSTTPKCGTGT